MGRDSVLTFCPIFERKSPTQGTFLSLISTPGVHFVNHFFKPCEGIKNRKMNLKIKFCVDLYRYILK